MRFLHFVSNSFEQRSELLIFYLEEKDMKRRLLSFILVALMALSFGACAKQQAPEGSSGPEQSEGKKEPFRVGMECDYAPLTGRRRSPAILPFPSREAAMPMAMTSRWRN